MVNFSRDGFDFLPGALIEIDLSSRLVIYMNRIAFSLFEHTQADIESGLPLRNIFFTESEYERSIRVAESFGLDNYQNRTAYTRYEKQDLYDFMMKRKDGSQFYAECQGSFVLDDDLVPIGARIYIRDLSEQRILEAKHLENEEKYRTLVENSSDIIFLIDNLGTVISVNQAATKYLRLKANEIEGLNIKELFPPRTAETFMGYLNKALLSGKRMIYETPMPTSKKSIWVSTSFNPVRDRTGNITALLGVSRDITERKHSEEQLERALIEARNANKVKDQFIANISHEIRTPLTTITGFAGRLKQSLGNKLKPAEEDFFKFINNSSTRLLKTLDAIINISELEANNSNVELFGTVVQSFEPRFFEVCPQCGKRAKPSEGSFNCAAHGPVTPQYSYVMNAVLDDGTETIRGVFFRDQAEKLVGKSREEMLSYKDNVPAFDAVKNELLGKQIKVVGRVNKNEMFERLEFVVNQVDANPDPKQEIERIGKQ